MVTREKISHGQAEYPVSVILCNHNYGRYIAEAINSILEQTYGNFELIIVDDGSTDNSREIIETFGDNRIRRIYQHNQGQAAAFNNGFSAANGRFIAFMDSDDIWKPEKLERCLHYFNRRNYSVVQHMLEMIDESGKPLGRIHPYLKCGRRDALASYFNEHQTGYFSATSGIVCRRSDLVSVFPLNTEWNLCADVAITRPLALFGDVYTLHETPGYYRVHGKNNWMGSDSQNNYADNELKYCEYAESWTRRFGYREHIDFSKSEIYWAWLKLENNHRESLGIIDRFKRLWIRTRRKLQNRLHPQFY